MFWTSYKTFITFNTFDKDDEEDSAVSSGKMRFAMRSCSSFVNVKYTLQMLSSTMFYKTLDLENTKYNRRNKSISKLIHISSHNRDIHLQQKGLDSGEDLEALIGYGHQGVNGSIDGRVDNGLDALAFAGTQ